MAASAKRSHRRPNRTDGPSDGPTPTVWLRVATEADIGAFFEQQRDRVAAFMAAFTAKEEADYQAFLARWRTILGDGKTVVMTIVVDGQVAGHVVSFEDGEQSEISFWVAREFWGRGVATRAVRQFLEYLHRRPLYARTVRDNVASIRVLEKCGFAPVAPADRDADARRAEIDEVVLELPAS